MSNLTGIKKLTPEVASKVSCSHSRAAMYFTESINPLCKFPTIKCRNFKEFEEGKCFNSSETAQMGYYAKPSDKEGSYFLYTRHSSPFCCE